MATIRRSTIALPLAQAALAGVFAGLFLAERLRPLRGTVEKRSLVRLGRNLAMAGLTAAAVQIVERPIVGSLAEQAARRRWGLLPALGLPRWAERAVGLALMDYTLYVWHRLTHRVPFLWRFHQVHHADLDMDTSTAIRFHFGEFVLSVPWRAAQILAFGIDPATLQLWQRLTLAEVLFHHSNLRLPRLLERRLGRFIVTPRMHGIHHSIVPDETESNWSSGLAVWDDLHGTRRRDAPQREVTIGVPELRNPRQVRLLNLVRLPFRSGRSGPPAQQAP